MLLLGGIDNTNLIVKGVNVEMSEDISVCLCQPLPTGKKDWSQPTAQDITNGFMKMMTAFMIKVMNRRIREFDSTDLILKLIEKLPADKAGDMLTKLK
jgi:hypothetical protein